MLPSKTGHAISVCMYDQGLFKGGEDGQKSACGSNLIVDGGQRTPELKLDLVLEGLKSGNTAETCRRYEIAANLYYRWKDEALQGVSAALGGEAPGRPKARRTGAFGSWNARWDGRRWRSRS